MSQEHPKEGARPADGQRPGLLDGISASQVVAGALASVTSVLLASRIGVAGSLLGVVVASAVSTVASQLYRTMISRSADKLRTLANRGDAADGAQDLPAAARRDEASLAAETRSVPARRIRAQRRVAADELEPEMRTVAGTRIAPDALRAEAARRRERQIRRRVVMVAIISSLAAVAVTALAISHATGGKGIQPLPAPTENAPATAPTSATAAKTPERPNATQGTTATRQPEASIPAEDTKDHTGNEAPSTPGKQTDAAGSDDPKTNAAGASKTQQRADTPQTAVGPSPTTSN